MKEVKICDLDFQGRGIAKIDGKVFFVRNALINEVVKIKLIKENKHFSEAIAVEFLEKSSERITPSCKYFLECGGCDLMHMKYESQLDFKENKIKTTINKFSGLVPIINPIIKADNIFNYRNKITFHIKNDIGFFEKKTNEFIKIDNCLICNQDINDLISEIKKLDLSVVKNIIVRASKKVSQKMLIIETDQDLNVSNINGFDSIYIKKGNDYILKIGQERINEKMNNFTFCISPSAFFQVNTEQAIKLYDKVKSYANLTGKETVLDLYCGTGSIGIYLAKSAKKVYGIEINEEAINDANINKKINRVDNICFYALNANQFLTKISEKIDLVIVDPPRVGLDKKTIESVLKIAPSKIIYVSCDVATLARDLKMFNEFYNVLEITPVDMFPNTCHCESITVLERRY